MCQVLYNVGIVLEYIVVVLVCLMCEGIVLYNNEGILIWVCVNVDVRVVCEVSEFKELYNNIFENEVYCVIG